jgi:uncharacterized RDD family membrane protein YckC
VKPDDPGGHDAPLASLGRRFLARAIDQSLLYFVIPLLLIPPVALALVVVGVIEDTPNTDPDSTAMQAVFASFGFGWLASAVLEVVSVAVWGRTPGKWLLGMRVVAASDRRGRIGLARSAARFGIMWGSLTTVVTAELTGGSLAAGYVSLLATPASLAWALRDRQRQGLHDKGCGSVVIRTSSTSSLVSSR